MNRKLDKILILGGYGVFGGRLAELISDMDIDVLICGRSAAKAAAKCQALQGTARFIPLPLDRVDIAGALRDHTPDIVIDASGPFQDYGDAPYAVIRACLDAGIDYMDFADAADFALGVRAFNEEAKSKGVTILSGVSSFPVLTAAVLREFQKTMTVHSLSGGIAPSPYAGIGLNVMRAVVSYAGGDVKLTRAGKPHVAKGLAESLRYTVAAPGKMPLKNLHFSLVDVPDLQILPAQNPDLQDIWMGAGPVPEILHKVLNLLAKSRAALRLPSFEVFSPLFFWVLNKMKFGEHRGGMFVSAKGVDKDGRPAAASWHLLAEGDDGPYIPSMAIEALLRKRAGGDISAPGARVASQELEVADYMTLFEGREIYAGFRNDSEPASAEDTAPIFETVLGAAFDDLPPRLQHFHSQTGPQHWRGTAKAQAASSLLGKSVARIVGLNLASGDWPVDVRITPTETGELWERQFGPHKFNSMFSLGSGKNDRLITEQFGPAKINLAAIVKDDRLYLVPRRVTLLGIPLPGFMLPKEDSYEYEKDGRFYFNVNVKVPFAGRIAHYHGSLEKVSVTQSARTKAA